MDWTAEAVATLANPGDGFTCDKLESNRPAAIAAIKRRDYVAVWLAVRAPVGYDAATVLLMPLDSGGWSSPTLQMCDEWESLPVLRPAIEWDEYGPVWWETCQWWGPHEAHVVHHNDHDHHVGPLPNPVLVVGGVAAQQVQTVVLRLDDTEVTLPVDPATGVYFGAFATECNDPTSWLVMESGDRIYL